MVFAGLAGKISGPYPETGVNCRNNGEVRGRPAARVDFIRHFAADHAIIEASIDIDS